MLTLRFPISNHGERGGWLHFPSSLLRMVAFSSPLPVVQRNRRSSSRVRLFLCSDEALAYSIREYQLGLLQDEDLPPPLDHYPLFPDVAFTHGGEPLLFGLPEVPESTVLQIVPDPRSSYPGQYGIGDFRDWESPDDIYGVISDWYDAGKEVVVHPRLQGVQVAGESRGMSRFVVGAGVSVFVIHELGLLPSRVELGGELLEDMIVAFAVTFPESQDHLPTYHVMPAEYLADPYLPGAGPGWTQWDNLYHLSPPPVFCVDRERPIDGLPGAFHTFVRFGVSVRELAEEGARDSGGVAVRGVSYRLLRGVLS